MKNTYLPSKNAKSHATNLTTVFIIVKGDVTTVFQAPAVDICWAMLKPTALLISELEVFITVDPWRAGIFERLGPTCALASVDAPV